MATGSPEWASAWVEGGWTVHAIDFTGIDSESTNTVTGAASSLLATVDPFDQTSYIDFAVDATAGFNNIAWTIDPTDIDAVLPTGHTFQYFGVAICTEFVNYGDDNWGQGVTELGTPNGGSTRYDADDTSINCRVHLFNTNPLGIRWYWSAFNARAITDWFTEYPEEINDYGTAATRAEGWFGTTGARFKYRGGGYISNNMGGDTANRRVYGAQLFAISSPYPMRPGGEPFGRSSGTVYLQSTGVTFTDMADLLSPYDGTAFSFTYEYGLDPTSPGDMNDESDGTVSNTMEFEQANPVVTVSKIVSFPSDFLQFSAAPRLRVRGAGLATSFSFTVKCSILAQDGSVLAAAASDGTLQTIINADNSGTSYSPLSDFDTTFTYYDSAAPLADWENAVLVMEMTGSGGTRSKYRFAECYLDMNYVVIGTVVTSPAQVSVPITIDQSTATSTGGNQTRTPALLELPASTQQVGAYTDSVNPAPDESFTIEAVDSAHDFAYERVDAPISTAGTPTPNTGTIAEALSTQGDYVRLENGDSMTFELPDGMTHPFFTEFQGHGFLVNYASNTHAGTKSNACSIDNPDPGGNSIGQLFDSAATQRWTGDFKFYTAIDSATTLNLSDRPTITIGFTSTNGADYIDVYDVRFFMVWGDFSLTADARRMAVVVGNESTTPDMPDVYQGTTGLDNRNDANAASLIGSPNSFDYSTVITGGMWVRLEPLTAKNPPTSVSFRVSAGHTAGSNASTSNFSCAVWNRDRTIVLAAADSAGTRENSGSFSSSTTPTLRVVAFTYVNTTVAISDWQDAVLVFNLDFFGQFFGDQAVKFGILSVDTTSPGANGRIVFGSAISRTFDVLPPTASGNSSEQDASVIPNLLNALVAAPVVELVGDILRSYPMTLTNLDSRRTVLSTKSAPDADVSNDGTVTGGGSAAWEVLDSGLTDETSPNNEVELAQGDAVIVELSATDISTDDSVYGLASKFMTRFTPASNPPDPLDDTTRSLIEVLNTAQTKQHLTVFQTASDLGGLGNNFVYFLGDSSESWVGDAGDDPDTNDIGKTFSNSTGEFDNLRLRFQCIQVSTVGSNDGIGADIAWFFVQLRTHKTNRPIEWLLGPSAESDGVFNHVWAHTDLNSDTPGVADQWPNFSYRYNYPSSNPGVLTHAFDLDVTTDVDFLYAAAVRIVYDWEQHSGATSNAPLGDTIHVEAVIKTSDGATILAAADSSGTPEQIGAAVGRPAGTQEAGTFWFTYVNTTATGAQWEDAWVHIKTVVTLNSGATFASHALSVSTFQVTLFGGDPNGYPFPNVIEASATALAPLAVGDDTSLVVPDTILTDGTPLAPSAGSAATTDPALIDLAALVLTPVTETVVDDTALTAVLPATTDLLAPTVTTQQDANVFGFLLELDFDVLAPTIEKSQTVEPVAIPITVTPLAPTPRAGAQVTITPVLTTVTIGQVTLEFSVTKTTAAILATADPLQVIRQGGAAASAAVLEALLTLPAPTLTGTVSTSPATILGIWDVLPTTQVDEVNQIRTPATILTTGFPLDPTLEVGVSKITRPSTAALFVTMGEVSATAGATVIGLGVIITNLTTFTPELLTGGTRNPDVIAQALSMETVTTEGGGTTPLSFIETTATTFTPDTEASSQADPQPVDVQAVPLDPTTGDSISDDVTPDTILPVAEPLQVTPNQGGDINAPLVDIPAILLAPFVQDSFSDSAAPLTIDTTTSVDAPTLQAGQTAVPNAIATAFDILPAELIAGQTALPNTATVTVSMGQVDVTAGISALVDTQPVLGQFSMDTAAISGAATATAAQIATQVLLEAVTLGRGQNVDPDAIQVYLTPLQVSVFDIPDLDATVNVATIHAVATLLEANVATFVDATIEIVIEDVDPMSVFGKDWGVRTGGPGQYTGTDGGIGSDTGQQYQNRQGPRFSGGGGTFEGT